MQTYPRLAAAAALMMATAVAQADTSFDLNPATTQSDFRAMSEDIAAAVNYKALGPAEATGLTGFGIGAFAAYTKVENKAAWQNATGSDVDAIGLAGVAVHKGLPLNLDVGAFYAAVPGTDVKVLGGEVRYAILAGGVASPALGVRGSYTKTTGSDDFDFTTQGIDVEISKGFAVLTPYAGAGYLRSESTPHVGLLQKESFSGGRYYAGLRLSLLLLELTPEVERVGDNTSYNLRLGFSL